MTRWKASAIHLTLSVLVLCTIAAVLVWRWYPPGLFHMANADKLLLIIAGVDVVMGPLLTLIVYKQGKKRLKFDLTMIALLQLGAMGYGLHTVWQSRPVYMVAVIDRFTLVFANELEPEDLRAAEDRFRTLPWLNVETVAAVLPTDPTENHGFLVRSSQTGKDIDLLPKYYTPYAAVARGMLGHSAPAREFAAQLSGEEAKAFSSALQSTGLDPARVRVAPISSSRGDASMLLDARDGRPLKPVDVDPWPVLSALKRAKPKQISLIGEAAWKRDHTGRLLTLNDRSICSSCVKFAKRT
ncbi:TfpX/TfpZ family type IV pilin accessory protein [Lysobacter sp. P5_B9]